MRRIEARAAGSAALLAAVALLVGSARAQAPATAIAQLKYHEFETPQEMIDLSAGGVEAELQPQTAARRGRRTAAPVERRTFRLTARWLRKPVTGTVGRPAGTATFNRLWLDWNHDRRVDGNEHFEGVSRAGGSLFGPLRRPGADSLSPPLYLLVHENTHVHLVPAGRYEGELQLGGRAVRVGVVDADCDGVLGEQGILGQEGDLLLEDFNGDSKFTGVSETWMAHPWDLEALPLRASVQMPDGAYYGVSVTRAGDQLTATPDVRPTGKVRLHSDRFAMEVVGGSDRIWVRSTGGEATLPAGSYLVPWVVLGVTEPGKGLWTASILPRPPGLEKDRLQVTAGAAVDCACGPPFHTMIGERGRGRWRTLSVSLQDVARNPVTEILTPDGRRPSGPELRLKDGTGRLLKEGHLTCGSDFRCSVTWLIPPFSGDLHPSVEWPLGPFTVPAGEAAQPASTGGDGDAARLSSGAR